MSRHLITRSGLAFISTALTFLPLGVYASSATLVPLVESIQPVAEPSSSVLDPKRPTVTRRVLKTEEAAAAMDFEVALKLRNFAELKSRVTQGELIPLAEMKAKYQPDAADYQSVVDWLKSQGLVVTRHDQNHMAIFARGTVTQLQQTLNVTFARVAFGGEEYTSALTAPNVPSNLSSLLVGINGLQPHLHPHKHLVMRHNLTGTNPPYLPSQIAQAYNATPLYSAGITGAGQSIAIVIDTFPLKSDLTKFWQTYGVNQSINNIDFIQVVAGTLPALTGEETLDTEWSSSIAPGAQVRVYATTSLSTNLLDEAYQQVYTDATSTPSLGLHQMSMSYGQGETYSAQSQVETDDQYFVELASAGVTSFASTGDSGSTPSSSGTETGALQVETPASDPFVTGVGGTSLTLNSSGNESSESVWNNATGSSGGGTSIYFGRPVWQTGAGVPIGNMRLVPDVSCSADPDNGAVLVLNGSPLPANEGYGGTSWSSPTVAGFCALLNQTRSNGGLPALGLLGPRIYPLIGTTSFRDITTGNNATSNSGGLYAATAGYDRATGIGVLAVQTLAQPQVQSVTPGQNATFTATVSGTASAYQWQQMPVGTTTWSNLSDGTGFTGSTTATLTVNSASSSETGDRFRCLVTLSSSVVLTSPTSTLIVETPLLITTLAGSARVQGNTNGTGTAARFSYPSGLALDTSGNIYVADYGNNAIREVTPPTATSSGGLVTTLTLSGSPSLNTPNGIAIDHSNNLYIADTGNNLVRKSTNGVLTTLGGTSIFNAPGGVAVDAAGNVFVADSGNDVIRKITSGGVVSVLAGTVGVTGDVDGTGTAARFSNPSSVAVDSSDNVYVADFGNSSVRKITPAGVVTTLAGLASVLADQDGVGNAAFFNSPTGVAVDGAGNVYVTDAQIPAPTSTVYGNDLIRKITPTGVVSTLAGQAGAAGSSNGTGTAAQFYSPQALVVTGTGGLYIADAYNQLIRTAGSAPLIVTQPQSEIVTAGKPALFSVTVSGTGPFSYQWLKDGLTILGATQSSYGITSTSGSDTGGYSVVVSNPFGTVTSGVASLVVVAAQPMAQTATSGSSVTLSVAVANNSLSYTYQYLFNGTPIAGATGPNYTITNVSAASAGNYSVLIGDSYGTVATTPVTLTVSPAMASSTDSPTLPEWGLIALAGLLLLAAVPLQNEKRRV